MKFFRHLVLSSMLISSAQTYAANWVDDLLNLTGTSLIFEQNIVQQALQDNQTIPDLNQLLENSHFQAWAGARLWIVYSANGQLQSYQLKEAINNEANQRGLLLSNKLSANDITLLNIAITSYKTNSQPLKTLLQQQQYDGLVLINQKDNIFTWKILTPNQQFLGAISQDGLIYLPHIWAENLGMAWQWPDLNNDFLVRIDNIKLFEQFIQSEQILKTHCSQVRLLSIDGYQVNFACQTNLNYSQLHDKLRQIPVFSAKQSTMAATNLAMPVMMGRQLSQRFLHYQWLNNF